MYIKHILLKVGKNDSYILDELTDMVAPLFSRFYSCVVSSKARNSLSCRNGVGCVYNPSVLEAEVGGSKTCLGYIVTLPEGGGKAGQNQAGGTSAVPAPGTKQEGRSVPGQPGLQTETLPQKEGMKRLHPS